LRIAITADVHLTSYKKNPERYNALENILVQMVEDNIRKLIIAGDLFDSSCDNPGEFENLIDNEKYNHLIIYIIPGNHDPALSRGTFTSHNIHFLTNPELINLSEDVSFFFLPYSAGTTQGQVLAAFQKELENKSWILVAHGDYRASTNLRNPYEAGYYMPLSRREIHMYHPLKVFLGHIHVPFDSDLLHYPGSPCGVDISEKGIRSFIIYDTNTNKIKRQSIRTDVIYFQETLTVLPVEDEVNYLRDLLERRISAWGLDEEQKQACRARIIVQGYSNNRQLVLQTITDYVTQENISLLEPVDLSKVKISDDVMRADIVLLVQERLYEMCLSENEDEPTIDDYILSAMNQIYRG